MWTAAGIPVTTATGEQTTLQLLAINSDQAIVSWHDWRGISDPDIYATRVTAPITAAADWNLY